MTFLRTLPFLIPVLVMLFSEITKAMVEYLRTGSWHAGIFKTGGMPSSHSAFVTSLLIIVERSRGVTSIDFAIAFTVAAVVWYDAVSLRREVGLQAEMLNRIQHLQQLRTRIGHSVREVLAGIAFGTLVTYAGIAVAG